MRDWSIKMKKHSARDGHGHGEPRGVLWGVDLSSPEAPLSPTEIEAITQGRKEAQVQLRKRIDEGMTFDE
jgi:hypothetical protein